MAVRSLKGRIGIGGRAGGIVVSACRGDNGCSYEAKLEEALEMKERE
jgi:hypothetical protein